MKTSKQKKQLPPFKLGATASHLEAFAENVEYLWSQKNIPILAHPPSPLEFCRDYVQCSRPCIIRNSILDETTGKPLLLTLDSIVKILDPNDTSLTVDVTPDGHGDCVRTFSDGSKMFVQPCEVKMSLSEFQRQLRRIDKNQSQATPLDINGKPILSTASCKESSNPTPTLTNVESLLPEDSVVYYSRQNDCLRQEIPNLKDHFPTGITWAEEAFGPLQPLDAVNLWVGNELATSSMHKDHYENLFYVASGEKIFTVCPPANVAYLYEHEEFSRGAFQVDKSSNAWQVARIGQEENDEQNARVHWIAPDVTILQDGEKASLLKREYPLLEHVTPIDIRVRAGEMLYLPSLWFHRVTQSCETIGVNYWYEMKFDSPLWCYFSFLQQLQHCDNSEEEENDKRLVLQLDDEER